MRPGGSPAPPRWRGRRARCPDGVSRRDAHGATVDGGRRVARSGSRRGGQRRRQRNVGELGHMGGMDHVQWPVAAPAMREGRLAVRPRSSTSWRCSPWAICSCWSDACHADLAVGQHGLPADDDQQRHHDHGDGQELTRRPRAACGGTERLRAASAGASVQDRPARCRRSGVPAPMTEARHQGATVRAMARKRALRRGDWC